MVSWYRVVWLNITLGGQEALREGVSFGWGGVTAGITTVWEETKCLRRNKEMSCTASLDSITSSYFALHITELTPTAKCLSVYLSVCQCASFRLTLWRLEIQRVCKQWNNSKHMIKFRQHKFRIRLRPRKYKANTPVLLNRKFYYHLKSCFTPWLVFLKKMGVNQKGVNKRP